MNWRRHTRNILLGLPGWHTDRHIVVIESDDWGSVRMPSLEVYEKLVSMGVKFGKYGYEKVDTIASGDDLDYLFEVCNSFSDIHGSPAVITANTLVANPDFARIKASDFTEYFCEPFTQTMEFYYPGRSPFPIWKEGMGKGVFFPQLHGREHVNVQMWMNSLRKDHPGVRTAFDEGVYSVMLPSCIDRREKNTAAFCYINESEKPYYPKVIHDAQLIFESLFGYKSLSFIAPSYCYDRDIEDCLFNEGVRYMQGIHSHIDQGKRQIRYVGQKSGSGLISLVRNAEWEPALNPNKDNNDECLKQIETAFRWRKPATVSIHRLNFIGALDVRNRDNNLNHFKSLLKSIQKNWPDVEFLTSVDLGNLISESCRELS